MKPIPCKDCICFAVCNAKVHRLDGVYKTRFVIYELHGCSLINNWIDTFNNDGNGNHYPYSIYSSSKEQLKIICKCFNLKYDIIPEYNLLRHLNHFKTMTTNEDHRQRI